MPRITSLDELNRLKIDLVMKRNEEAASGMVRITVGMGTCGIAAGASAVFTALEDEIQALGLRNVDLSQTGCIGLCKHEPIVEVTVGRNEKVSYGNVTPCVAKRIVDEHVQEGHALYEYIIDTTPFPTI
jgi:NADP-reducing hydrogenase subunit HndB